jgi:hypothetical protein
MWRIQVEEREERERNESGCRGVYKERVEGLGRAGGEVTLSLRSTYCISAAFLQITVKGSNPNAISTFVFHPGLSSARLMTTRRRKSLHRVLFWT